LTRELEKLGASASAKAGRDYVAYALSATRLSVPEATELLIDAASNPKLNYWEVSEAIAHTQVCLHHCRRVHRAAWGCRIEQVAQPSAQTQYNSRADSKQGCRGARMGDQRLTYSLGDTQARRMRVVLKLAFILAEL
jgi:hypothetical protein